MIYKYDCIHNSWYMYVQYAYEIVFSLFLLACIIENMQEWKITLYYLMEKNINFDDEHSIT